MWMSVLCPWKANESDNHPANVLTLTVMARLQRVGREMRMLVETPRIRQQPIPAS